MNQTLVLGSGFGLYGYTPALLARGDKVLLPEHYRETVRSRDDLRIFDDEFRYCSVEEAMELADEVIIARAPFQQAATLATMHRKRKLACLYLEKPLASSPEAAHQVLSSARLLADKVKVGYLFSYLEWYKQLDSLCAFPASEPPVTIEWQFQAHHWEHGLETWKKEAGYGGGVLRFYGIHLIAIAAKMGYQHAGCSELIGQIPGQPTRWYAMFKAKNKRSLIVDIDSNAEQTKFAINVAGLPPIIEINSPFDIVSSLRSGGDLRSTVIGHYLDEEYTSDIVNWYDNTIDLWAMTETQTHFSKREDV